MVKQYVKLLAPLFSSSRQEVKGIWGMLPGFLILFFLMGWNVSWGQTPFAMSGGNYSETFDNIANATNWPNNFNGTDSAEWSSVGIIGTGTSVTTGVRTTKSSATFVTTTSGGLQRGTTSLVFLSTGSGATPEAVAVDLLLNFSGRTAGTLSFDWTAIDNASGTRPTSLRVFWSTDGTTFTELSTAQVLDKVSPNSGSITTIALPTQFDNSSTARLRFYNHAGTVTGAGNRDKLQIDNIAVTSTSSSAPNLAITGTPTNFGTVCSNAPSTVTYTITNSGTVAADGVQVVSGGTNSAEYVVGGFTQNSTIAANGGTATYTVTFTPTATGSRTATITVSSTTSGSNSPTSNLTGIGALPVTQAVTTNDATAVESTTATLNGNVDALGVCPSSTIRGFVYSKTADDSDPNVGDSNVTATSVAAAAGSFALPLTGLPNGTEYAYKAYIYDGTTYVYGAIKLFTTTTPPVNDSCASATVLSLGVTNSGGIFTAASPDYGTSRDVWYSFVPTCSGTHTIAVNFPGSFGEDINFEVYSSVCPSSTAGRLQLFGGDGPSLTFIANSTSADNETADLQNAVSGNTYYIRVIDVSNIADTFDITVSTSVTPEITLSNTGTPAAGNIAAGANNVVLYGFTLTPSACSSGFSFTAANIATTGDADNGDLSNFRLIVDASNFGVADAGEVSAAIGSASFTNGNPLAFSSLGQSLTGGTATRYLLIADVSSGATNARTFTASLANTDITANQTVTGSAAGNQQSITATSITIANNGTQVAAGNILRGTNTTVISKAKFTVAGGTASVTQIDFATAGSSGAYVQSDIATNGFKLWRTASSTFDTNTLIGSVSSSKVTATNNETVSFTTSESLSVGDYYYWLTVDVLNTAIPTRTITVNGMNNTSIASAGNTILGSTSAAGAQTIISPTLTIADNTVVPAGTILVNTADALIARAQLTPSNSNIGVTDISFVTAGNASGYTNADIAANGFKLWYSTTNTFGSASLFGTAQSSTKTVATNTETVTFSDSQNLTDGTPYYFWLTASISSGATPGNTITVNGLSNTGVTSTTSGVFITGSSSASGSQTIVDNAPSLTTSPASVDAPFSITLSPDNANYRNAITSVKIGATSLVFTTSANSITLDPANASNTLLRTPGTKTIDITATNYTPAQVSQVMLVGATAKLAITTALVAPTANGGQFATQPVISYQDKYGNPTTSTETVRAAKQDAGSWILGGTTDVVPGSVSSSVAFTDLTATSGAVVNNAQIRFSLPNVSGSTPVDSATFTIVAPVANQIVFVNPPSTGVTGSNLAAVRVEARTPAGTIDTNYTGAITISATGPGTLTATTLSKAAIAGVATFNDLKIDTAGSYSLKADSSTFTQISTPLTIVDPIAKWTFEGVTTTNTGATVNVSVGSAVADAGLQTSGSAFTAVHASAATVWSNVAGNGSAKSVSANTWAVNDYFQFKVNTSGFTAIKVQCDQTGSNTGPRDFKLQYSTTAGGASGYTDFISYSVPQTATPAAIGWSSAATSATSLSTLKFDLSALSVLNGKSEVYFRVVNNSTTSLQNLTVAAGGTGRIDNFTVLGTACPTLSASVTSGTTPICGGNNATFNLSGTPGALISYTLNGSNSVTLDGSGLATITVNSATTSQTLVLVSASLSGCSNAVSGSATVTVTPNVGTPSFTAGATAVCQDAADTTYTATASNSTAITYSVAPIGAGTIDSSTGVMNWNATFNGTATITATATGCNGPTSADRVVTVSALPVVTASDVSGCSGTPIALSGSGTPTGGTGSFSVANPYVGTTSATYTYTYQDLNGCSATSASANITITAQPQWYLDADNDGYYTGTAIASCTSPGAGYTTSVLGGGDCNDASASIYPGATEICYNNILENCSGTLSQGCAPVVVNMTPSYNNTTLVSLATAVPAVAYTYPGTSNLKYRFSITNVTSGAAAVEVTQTSRYITIPASLHSYNAQYTIKVSAVINDEVVPYAGNTITLNSPSVQLVTLNGATCGATLATLASTITANAGLNATGYTFRIRLNDSNPTPTYYTSQSATRFVSANSFAGFPLQYSTSYKVSVQYTFNDPVTNLPVDSGYGAECTVNTPSIPLTALASPTCGSTVAALNANISASAASYATSYQFRIRLFADNGPTPTYYYSVPNASRFSSLTAFQGITFAYSTAYSISVQYSVLNGATAVWSGYGAECKVTTPFFPTTSLVPSQCGLLTATSLTQQLNITPYPGFPNYKVKLEEVSGEDIVNSEEIIVSYSNFRLNQFSIAQAGKNYNVSVAIKLNGVFGDYSTACDLFTAPLGKTMTAVSFKATAYPNPFANNFMLDVKTNSQSAVNLKVYDMVGRLIEQRNVTVSDMGTTTIGDQYPTGVYNVVVSQEDSVETVRVVKR